MSDEFGNTRFGITFRLKGRGDTGFRPNGCAERVKSCRAEAGAVEIGIGLPTMKPV